MCYFILRTLDHSPSLQSMDLMQIYGHKQLKGWQSLCSGMGSSDSLSHLHEDITPDTFGTLATPPKCHKTKVEHSGERRALLPSTNSLEKQAGPTVQCGSLLCSRQTRGKDLGSSQSRRADVKTGDISTHSPVNVYTDTFMPRPSAVSAYEAMASCGGHSQGSAAANAVAGTSVLATDAAAAVLRRCQAEADEYNLRLSRGVLRENDLHHVELLELRSAPHAAAYRTEPVIRLGVVSKRVLPCSCRVKTVLRPSKDAERTALSEVRFHTTARTHSPARPSSARRFVYSHIKKVPIGSARPRLAVPQSLRGRDESGVLDS
jgi:hypothetical protein